MVSNTFDNVAMDEGKIEGMATNFPEKFATSVLKNHRKFCRRGLTHLDATLTFKNHSDTSYEMPCNRDINHDEGVKGK